MKGLGFNSFGIGTNACSVDIDEENDKILRIRPLRFDEHYTPEELVGRQVLVLVNLEPRELRGVLSQGMILMAQDSSGKLVLLSPADRVDNGATIG